MIKLDERGKQCPLPVIETKRALQADAQGAAEVLVDNEIAVQNLQKMAAHLGYEAHAVKKNEREFCVRLQRRADAAAPSEQAQPVLNAAGGAEDAADRKENARDRKADAADRKENAADRKEDAADRKEDAAECGTGRIREGMVAVIASDCMGSGDEALGRLLMKGYLYALAQQDRLPQTILLYNRGAYLSCQGSEALGDLRDLEAMGVEILTCGTCLNHYELEKLLAVGGVTNMYEIVERQTAAKLILRP